MSVVRDEVQDVKFFKHKFRLRASSRNVIDVKCEQRPHNCDVGLTWSKFNLLQFYTPETTAPCFEAFNSVRSCSQFLLFIQTKYT